MGTAENPRDLTGEQRTTVATIANVNKPLYTGYLLKEQLREVFAAGGHPGRALLAGWPGPDDAEYPSSWPSPQPSHDTYH